MQKVKYYKWILFIMVLVVVFGGGGIVTNANVPLVVRLANAPYMNTMPWILPVIYGWDKELGIDLRITWFPDSMKANEAVVGGSQDLSCEAISVIMPLVENAPSIRQFLISDEFRGNAIEIRKGEFKTFEDFYEELGNVQEAQKATMSQMIGKELITTKGIWDSNIECALNQAGLTLKNVKIIDMQQSPGAAAFVKGLGDFYFGSLPQHIKLRSIEGGGKYVPMITSKYMGPGGLYITVTQTTEKFIKRNGNETLLKLAALWYRAINSMEKYPDEVYPVLTKWVNEKAGGGWDIEKVKTTVSTDKNRESLIYNPQLADVGSELILDPNSPTYYLSHAEWHVNNLVEGNKLKRVESINIEETYGYIEKVYQDLMKDKQLIEWIYEKPNLKQL